MSNRYWESWGNQAYGREEYGLAQTVQELVQKQVAAQQAMQEILVKEWMTRTGIQPEDGEIVVTKWPGGSETYRVRKIGEN